jgi:SAM-dependent methyltransferase
LQPAQQRIPTNYAALEADDARINADAQYAMRIAKAYIRALPGGVAALRGKSAVEIGPGINFGTPLVLACNGVGRIVVTDRFLVRFQKAYHTRLYRALHDAVRQEFPHATLRPLEQCIVAESHSCDLMQCVEAPLEQFAERFAGQFDLAFSNAVLEHVYDPIEAVGSLYRIMRFGGIAYHQVDFRDHRDFTRPLEYLLLDEPAFRALLEECHCECGNRIRPHELHDVFRRAGFTDPNFQPNMWAEESYLKDFIPRLHAAKNSPYHNIDESLLRVVSGLYLLTRTAAH